MRPRAAAAAMLLASLALAGCAAGRLLVGAPSPSARSAGAGASTAMPATRAPRSGQALLARRCVGCHEAPDPARMSPAEWQKGLERMKVRLHLPAAEWDSLAALRKS